MHADRAPGAAAGDPGLGDAYWMPFTANRRFRRSPRLLVAAEGMHYRTDDGRELLDGTSGLWCVNAGHARPRIVQAIARQAAQLDYAPPFQVGHPLAFELAERLAGIAPQGLSRVFFANSGSEAVDTALKLALGYHRARGEASRTRLIGRERGYHGVNLGGTSAGGIVANRRGFGPLLPGIDHLRHTHDPARNAFSVGQPAHGEELADDLERLVALHDASTIAAVIVEPMAGSTGVLLPPAGYLQRLRRICDRHGILLIFDEVITGFGRLGAPFAAQHYGVVPDLMAVAKGITNGAVPMGAVLLKPAIQDAYLQATAEGIEFFHGYTCSAHPLACAAALATLDTYAEEALLTRAASLDGRFAQALHALRDLPGLLDIRNTGLVGALEFEPRPGAGGQRGFAIFEECWRRGLLVRVTGDTVALSPPLIIEQAQIDRLAETLRGAVLAVG